MNHNLKLWAGIQCVRKEVRFKIAVEDSKVKLNAPAVFREAKPAIGGIGRNGAAAIGAIDKLAYFPKWERFPKVQLITVLNHVIMLWCLEL